MAVAPFVSLAVIPFAFSRIRVRAPARDPGRRRRPARAPAHAQVEEATTDLSLRHGAGFAVAVVGIMLSEQALMNAGVLIVAANAAAGVALTLGLTGFVFNVMLIVRAPLQLFQAIQTSILPHLAGLEARESADEFHRAIRITILAIAAFALAVALGLLLIGPAVMTALLGDKGFPTAASGSRSSASGWACTSSPGRSTRRRWRAARARWRPARG